MCPPSLLAISLSNHCCTHFIIKYTMTSGVLILQRPYRHVRIFWLQAISGGLFITGIFDMATKLSQPPYYYVYNHLNEKSYNSLFGAYPFPKKLGVTHADDTISLFYWPDQFGDLRGADLEVSKLVINLWTRFASAEYVPSALAY